MLELPIAEVAPALGASPTTAQIGPTRNDGLPASPPCGGGCPTGPQRETLLGALGMVFGPVVGALMVVELENYLARLGAWVALVQGAIFGGCEGAPERTGNTRADL